MTPLFIEYANTDLRKNPEFLLKISEHLDWHYYEIHEQAGHIPWSEQHLNGELIFFNSPVGCGKPNFEHMVKKLLSHYGAIKNDMNTTGYPYIYAGSVQNRYKGYLDTALEICACEGAFYWAMNDKGCYGCRYNDLSTHFDPDWEYFEIHEQAGHIPPTDAELKGGQRDHFLENGKIPCFVCDWLAFRQMLSAKVAGKAVKANFHDLIQAYNEFNHKETAFRKGGFLEDFEYLSLDTDNPDWLIAPQRFSQVVMAVLMDDIMNHISQKPAKKTSPDPTDLIKQCRICNKFFIASRSNATNCDDCKGKEPPEVWRERQQKYRHSKDLKISRLYDRGIKFGLSHAEVESCLDYWINESGCNFSDVLNLPDSTIFSY
jgi:hypothetical protein